MLTNSLAQTQPNSFLSIFARYWLYPLLWLWTLFWLYYAYGQLDRLPEILAVKAVGMVGVLLLFEWLVPYRDNWGMTWRFLLRRDLIFIVVNGAFIGIFSYGFAYLALWISALTNGPLSGSSVWLQVIVALLVFEAMQYGIHRIMHENGTSLTNWLWRTHSIHHLPQQLYVVMHAVGHSFNTVIIRLCVQLLPLWILGFDPFPVLISSSIIALHGTVSHLNIDMRIGWANYLFVGPELHRYHHSANTNEAVNFAATLSIYDLFFGTFLYKPGKPPEGLGLAAEDGYPGQVDPLASMLFPLSTQPVETSSVR